MNMRKHMMLGFAAALALCGCVTEPAAVETRITKRSEAFNDLNKDQQERVRLGHIQFGDSMDMLWMSLGDPTTVSYTTSDGQTHESVPWKTYEELYDVFPAITNCTGETWTYIREPKPQPGPVLPKPSVDGYQPGAMYAPEPPAPRQRVTKVYVMADGVIVDMRTTYEPLDDTK